MNKRDRILKEIFNYHIFEKPDKQPNVFVKFWQKSYNHFNIIILLGSVAADQEGYSYEDICEIYPHRYASRTTVMSILREGIENYFFVKEISAKDRRKHNYKLSSERKKDVISWLDNHPIRQL